MISSFLKNFVPRTLYGRAAAILLLPMLTVQLAVAVIFVQRHFEDVTRQMTQNILLEIAIILNEIEEGTMGSFSSDTANGLNIDVDVWHGRSSNNARLFYDISGRTIVPLLYEKLDNINDIDLSDLRYVKVAIDSNVGPIEIKFRRSRVSASNPHQLLVLMVFTGIFMTIIAFFFLRNQLRPIKRLAAASAAFGRGVSLPFHPGGAIEVRAAGQAFLAMRDRIEQQIEQRTLMLSGVSHDLRTPITRIQLGLELLDGREVDDLKKDVDSMRLMVDSFLSYAGAMVADPVEDVDLIKLLTPLAARFELLLPLQLVGTPRLVNLREMPIERSVQNLLSNATRYAKKINLSIIFKDIDVSILVEDDGPGIPEESWEQAMRPFVRLETARTQDQSGSVGLGLAIAADVARTHGGSLRLGQSKDLGGLSAKMFLPL